MGKQITGVSDQALRLLLKHDFPVNARELENIIEHVFVLCKRDLIDLDCLPKELTITSAEKDTSPPLKEESPFGRADPEVIEKALKKYQGNRVKASQELGIDRTTLWRKIKRYGLQ